MSAPDLRDELLEMGKADQTARAFTAHFDQARPAEWENLRRFDATNQARLRQIVAEHHGIPISE